MSPCNFAITNCVAERRSFVSLELRDRPFDSLHFEFLSPFNLESPNGGSQTGGGAQGHSLQFEHNHVQVCTFVAFRKGNFRRKMTTSLGNRGQLWTSTIGPHLQSPHLDFPDFTSGPMKWRTLLQHPSFRRTQEGCGGLGGENPAAFPKARPASKLARKLFQQGISDSHSLLEFSDS